MTPTRRSREERASDASEAKDVSSCNCLSNHFHALPNIIIIIREFSI